MIPLARIAIVLGLCLVALAGGCTSAPSARSEEDRSRIEELERENAALREQVQTLRNRLGEAIGGHASFCPSFPAIDAHVLEVSRASKLVVLDRGEQAGVEVGYVFDVYLGSRYKGRVRITTVQESTSSGQILSEKNPIVAGDNATTAL